MADLVGMDIGRYHIVEQLGEGGMATVYKAYDTRLEREVAVKVIRRDVFSAVVLGQVLKRFEREAKALARLSHPNIVPVIDYGEREGAPYLVMTYIPGGTLKQRTGKPLPCAEAARLLEPAADALAHAHEAGVVHRDVKPANILLTKGGKPMLSDFGIAKLVEGSETSLTATGVGIGTPEYMSPEQGAGRAVDHRTDIYALGIVFYELVTGRRPFTADTPMIVVMKHFNDPLPDPRKYMTAGAGNTAEVQEAAAQVLFKALAKDPDNRFQTMEEFRAALERLAGWSASPVSAGEGKRAPEPPGAVPTAQRPVPRVEITMDELAPNQPPVSSQPGWEKSGPGSSLRGGTGAKKPRRLSGKALAGLGLLAAGVVVGLAVWGFSGGGTAAPPPTTATAREVEPTRPPAAAIPPTAVLIPTKAPEPTRSPATAIPPTRAPAGGSAAACTNIGQKLTSNRDGMAQLCVPAGEFKMGAEDGGSDEKPVHSVYLDAYWIDWTEVTNGMYARCVQAGVCKEPPYIDSNSHREYYGNSTYKDYPVIWVDWNQAQAYCAWAGRRLPSEAEWEKAARGLDGRRYPWGNNSPSCNLANYYKCVDDTSKVGSLPQNASPFGALDMAGNLEEWVSDWYGEKYYSSSPSRNPQGPSSGNYRVLRGGGWNLNEDYLRTTNRGFLTDDGKVHYLGFRCALSAAAP